MAARLAPLAGARFTYVEQIRYVGDDGGFEAVQSLADWLFASFGHGFAPRIITNRKEAIGPRHLAAQSFDWTPEQAVLAAHVSAWGLGLPSAVDDGAHDGLAILWTKEGRLEREQVLIWPANQIYLADPSTDAIGMKELAGKVSSVAVSSDGRKVAFIDSRGSGKGGLVWLEGEPRRLLTMLPGHSGMERLQFSPDDRYLLVTSGARSSLVEIATGRWTTFAAGWNSACWAPSLGPNAVLAVRGSSDTTPCSLWLLDLSTGDRKELGLLKSSDDSELRYVGDLALQPEGDVVLCVTPLGYPTSYDGKHGHSGRLAGFRLSDLVVKGVAGAFVDDESQLERVHCQPRWLARPSSDAISVTEAAIDGWQEPVTSVAPDRTEFLGNVAWNLFLPLYNSLAGSTQRREPVTLVSEFLRSLMASQRYAPSTYEKIREDTMQLVMQSFLPALSDSDPYSGSAWRYMGAGESYIRDGRPDEIAWEDWRYVSPHLGG